MTRHDARTQVTHASSVDADPEKRFPRHEVTGRHLGPKRAQKEVECRDRSFTSGPHPVPRGEGVDLDGSVRSVCSYRQEPDVGPTVATSGATSFSRTPAIESLSLVKWGWGLWERDTRTVGTWPLVDEWKTTLGSRRFLDPSGSQERGVSLTGKTHGSFCGTGCATGEGRTWGSRSPWR